MQRKLMEQGLKHLEEGQYEEATQILSVLVQNYPDNADGHHLLGIIALELNNLEEAYMFVHTALSLAPDNSIFYTTMGNIQLHRHYTTEAEQAFEKAVTNDSSKIEYTYNLASFYLSQSDYVRAIENYNRVLRLKPEHYLSTRGITVCYLFAGENDAALEHASKWAHEFNMHHEPFYILGLCQYANNMLPEALKNFDEALDIYPNCHEATTAMAACYSHLGNDNIANSYLQRSLGMETNNPSALFLLACVKHALGQHKSAQDVFLNAIRLDVEFPIVALQNLDGALLHCKNKQKEDPLFFLKCSGADYVNMLSSGL